MSVSPCSPRSPSWVPIMVISSSSKLSFRVPNSSLVSFLAQLSPTHTKPNTFNQPCAEAKVVMYPPRQSQYNRGGSISKEPQRPSGWRCRDRVMCGALWDGSVEGFGCAGHHGKAKGRDPEVRRASWEGSVQGSRGAQGIMGSSVEEYRVRMASWEHLEEYLSWEVVYWA